MKAKITRTDGTVIEAEGTAEEISKLIQPVDLIGKLFPNMPLVTWYDVKNPANPAPLPYTIVVT